MKDFLKDLNEVQYDAVTQISGPSLVIAGAGSGKTRVLTFRIAHLLNQGVHPRSILALTFTNKAAKEMKERIGQLVGENRAKSLWMGTFHSIFARILRTEAEALGYPSTFTIYDSQDSKNSVRQIIKAMNLDDTVYKPNNVFSRISSAKNNLVTPQAYANSPRTIEADANSRMPKIVDIYREYVTRCYKAGVMDFDDLLLNTNVLFRDFPDILHKYQQMFQYILVDEYQDTNYAQYLIVKKLAQSHRNICVVGDDAQSIYSFRGAKIENILNFRNDYQDYKLFKLEQNYRSTQTIVNAANSLIGKNRNQIQKKVFSENEIGDRIKVFKTATDHEEGFVVAGHITDIHMSDRIIYRDFAILYRTNAQSRIFEEALRKRNIPYKVYGGLSFYQRKEIKDLLAYLRLIVNPRDDEAFRRIINYPARGIGDTTVGRLEEGAQKYGVSFFEVAASPDLSPLGINKGTQAKIQQFIAFIRKFSVQTASMDAYELAYQVASGSGILNELKQDKTPENISKFENIEELLNSIREFTTQSQNEDGPLTLENYLENVALLTDADGEKPEDADKVTIMTIHASKGLEFKVVFIVGMEEDLFPSKMVLTSPDDVEEERRLFYVAITRAKEKAFLSFVETRFRWGNLTNCSPSRFLTEIDEQYLDLPQTSVNAFPSGFEEDEGMNWSRKPKFGGTSTPMAEAKSMFQPKKLVKLEKAGAGSATPSNFQATDPSKIQAGMEVMHERFGAGKIISLEGEMPNTKATVFFQAAGQKQLLLKFAKLQVL
ncbi:MAG: exodeoxyribonuclease V subunit gamma [Bacteroidota bacterium]|nr:exodeoxyribonuclease V subunit gamma [Bacteroidota bacterium]